MPDHFHALPSGYKLNEYRLERILGSGGFGITYYARDEHLNKPVAIKEYLPSDFAVRADGTSVRPKSDGDAGDYQWGLTRFLDEARALARFDHPHLNQVHRFFEAHGTAYLVLDYIDGETLAQMLAREGKLSEAPLRRLLGELLSGLEEVHSAGYVHRDVKPGNIMFRADGGAVLLDFGAARQAIGAKSKSVTSVLTPGYAPIEQYDQKADDVGAWSGYLCPRHGGVSVRQRHWRKRVNRCGYPLPLGAKRRIGERPASGGVGRQRALCRSVVGRHRLGDKSG